MPSKKKDKVTLSQLAMCPYKLTLKHPVLGDVDAYIELHGLDGNVHQQAQAKMVQQTNGHLSALMQHTDHTLQQTSKPLTDPDVPVVDSNGVEYVTDRDRLFYVTCITLSHMITDWDQGFFECKCTPENVYNVLSNLDNVWIYNQINELLGDPKNKKLFYKS